MSSPSAAIAEYLHSLRYGYRVIPWVLATLFCLSTTTTFAAPATSAEIEKGKAWLEAQVKPDNTVISEETSLAQVHQVRCEVRTTIGFFNIPVSPPSCVFTEQQVTELLARAGPVSDEFWLVDGGVSAATDYATRNAIDTIWGLNSEYGFPTDGRLGNSIAYLLSQQLPTGGFSLDGNEASVPFTAMAGAALQTQKVQLSKAQQLQLDLAAVWLKQRTTAANYWANAYQTALVHLFLVSVDGNPARDVAISERLIAEQLPNGSWANDPFVTAIVLRALATRSVASSGDTGYTLRVLDAVTSAPVPGLYIEGSYTDANGKVTIKRNPGADLSITIDKIGYVTKTITATIRAGVIADLGDVRLEPASTSFILSGTATDSVTGAPIPYVYMVDPERGIGGYADAQGYFSFVGTSAGPVTLQASQGGYEPARFIGTAVLGQSYLIELKFVPLSAIGESGISGVVIDRATRLPVVGAQVQWQSNSLSGNAWTDPLGAYAIESLRAEVGTITVTATGYAGEVVSGVRAAKPNTPLNFELETETLVPLDGTIVGTVVDDVTLLPVADVVIRLFNRNTNTLMRDTVSLSDGSFAFNAAAFDYYRIVLEKSGYQSAEVDINLFAYSPKATVNAALRRLISTVSGRVVDSANNQPIAGATVTIGTSTGITDNVGGFVLSEVVAGTYQASASALGFLSSSKSVVIQGLGPQSVGEIALQKVVAIAEIAGVVRDSKTNAPVVGATVKVGASLSSMTSTDGSYLVSGVQTTLQEVRVVADGYLPRTTSIEVTEARRYKVDVTLDKVADNTLALVVTTDQAQYSAYTPIVVRHAVSVPAAYAATGQLDVALIDSAGKVVQYVRYRNNIGDYDFYLSSSPPPVDVVLNTENLAPGRYSVESRLYEKSTFNAGPRAGLAVALATVDILETRRIESISVTTLPTYANFRATENTLTKVRIVNGSNVTITPILTATLKNPVGNTVATQTLTVPLRPDERVRELDLATGQIVFDPAGIWPSSVTVADVAVGAGQTAGKTTVLPGIRIEAAKTVAPGTITPDSERKIRVDIRIKGVQP